MTAIDAVEEADGRAVVVILMDDVLGHTRSLWLWQEGSAGTKRSEVTRLLSGEIEDPQLFRTLGGMRVTYHDGNALHVLSQRPQTGTWQDRAVHTVSSPIEIRAAAVAVEPQGALRAVLVLGDIQDWYGLPLRSREVGLWFLHEAPGQPVHANPVLLLSDLRGEQPRPSITVQGDSTFVWAALRRHSTLKVPGQIEPTWYQTVFATGREDVVPQTSDSLVLDSYRQPLNMESLAAFNGGHSMLAFGSQLHCVSATGERLHSARVATEFGRTGGLGRGRGVDVAAIEKGWLTIWVDHSEEMKDELGQMIDLANGGGWTTNQVHVGTLDWDPGSHPTLRDVRTFTGTHSYTSCVRVIPTSRGALLLWGSFMMAGRNPGASGSASQVWLARARNVVNS